MWKAFGGIFIMLALVVGCVFAESANNSKKETIQLVASYDADGVAYRFKVYKLQVGPNSRYIVVYPGYGAAISQ